MHSTRKTLTRCGLWALLAVALAAGGAEAAHRKKQSKSPESSCMQHCNENNQDKMRSCMQSCPKPRSGKMEAFQACSQRCGSNLNTDTCYERCEQSGGKHHGR
ncbi:MAG: hypothetical protein ACJ8AT_27035 [Hyalangium sp.]|uniref:hypothetical protein n=1 Tax=Hyalangium sp. TaxID=2028555 RepID=UPI00389A66C1